MGNLIEKRSGHSKLQSFSYDCENRLVRAEALVNGKLESTGAYRYDSLGRRVVKQSEINGITEQKRFLWQGLRMLREETPELSILYLYERAAMRRWHGWIRRKGKGRRSTPSIPIKSVRRWSCRIAKARLFGRRHIAPGGRLSK